MRISAHCYAVTGLGYSAPWCVNAGFIVGDHTTLIVDTGGNTFAAQTILGYASAAKPDNQLRVLNAEKHFDHIGGNSYFRRLGIDIWGHANIQRTPEEFEAEIAEFNDAIPSPARRAQSEARVFFHDTQLALPNQGIDSDTAFDLGGRTAAILLTPGHTPTNLSVWVEDERVLYTADCVVSGYIPNLDAGGVSDWQQWLQSLDRIAALQPDVIVPGHGPICRGSQVSAAIDRMRAILRQAIATGKSPTA